MAWFRLASGVLRSLLGFAGAALALWAGTAAGGWLAASLPLRAGGDARLAWDLAWLALGGVVAFALVSRAAPCRPRAHAIVLLLLLLGAALWAVVNLGQDFPAWFNAAVLASVPLQYGLGAEAYGIRRHPRPPARSPRVRTGGAPGSP